MSRAAGFLLAAAALAAFPLGAGPYPVKLVTEIFIYGIFAMSLDLLVGYTGLMSFGHAAFFGLGAYGMIVLGAVTGADPWLCMGFGVLLSIVGAVIVGWLCVRVSGIAFLMLTFAFCQLLCSVALRWRGVTGGSDGISAPARPTLGALTLGDSLPMFYTALLAMIASFLVLDRITRAPLGYVFRGIRGNEARMRAIGYATASYKLLAFVIAGGFAGIAGALYAAFNGFISADALSWSASGDVVVMVVLGGTGTLIGPMIGAAIFLLMQNIVSSYTEHWMAFIGVVFISCVMYFREGIWGTASVVARRRAS